MKQLIVIMMLLCYANLIIAQQTKPAYNKKLADSLGADKRGMKMYQFVILKTGDSMIADKQKISELFKGHMENIGRLASDGKLIVAGPFEKNDKQYRGLYIFTTTNKEETEKLLITDPAIKSGLLKAEIYSWYGSAALPMYMPYHTEIQKK